MTGPVYYLVWLVLGTVYPAYESFKAVKSKNAKHYVRWMMYWIVYALFTASESLMDPLLHFWLPFYAEAKVVFLLYLISSSTRGSSVIYKTWIHPVLCSNEVEIDVAIEKIKLKSFQTAKRWIQAGFQRVGGFVTNTAMSSGGGLVQQFQRSYSMVDLTQVGDQRSAWGSTSHEDEEENFYLKSRIKKKHYQSEACLHNPKPSNLNRWKSPEMISSESISSGYSTDSLLPSFDDQQSKFDEPPFDYYNTAHNRKDEIPEWEENLEELMMAMRKSKRKMNGKF